MFLRRTEKQSTWLLSEPWQARSLMSSKSTLTLRKPNGKRVSIGISTGDYDSSDPWLERYDVIIITNEKADSLLRHRAKWMDEISLVIADEVHLLNEAERGPTLEVVIARLMQINPEIQILALSATINNVDEIAGWLNAKYVITEWRPVPLKEGHTSYMMKYSTETATRGELRKKQNMQMLTWL